MARFGQLRWVPMLIRAYYDAQSRLETDKTAPVTSSDNQSRDGGSTALAQKIEGPVQKTTVHKRRAQNRVMRRPTTQRQRIPSKRNHTSQSDRTLRLLRELQTANRRLASLESIEQRLSQMGIALDEFNQQMAELKAEQEGIKTKERIAEPGDRMPGAPPSLQGQGSNQPPYAF